MIRLAVVSTAHIHTRGFLDNIATARDGRQTYAIWDDVTDRGQRHAAAAGARFVARLDELVADPAVDGFIICAENTRHLPLLQAVLPAGKPVFCEKPLVTTLAEGRELAALLRRHPDAQLLSGYFYPFSAPMQAVAQWLAAGRFGRPTRARFRNAHHAAYGRWFDSPDCQWFHNPALAGGGAMMDMGTHAVHLLRTLFGPVTEVWAMIRNEAGIYPAVDDYGLAQLQFASGVLGTVEAAWTQTGGIGGLEITGSEKSLWPTAEGYRTGGPRQPAEPLPAAAERPTRVDRLVATIRGELSPEELRADLTAAMDAVAIMDAIYESARLRQWVRVPALA